MLVKLERIDILFDKDFKSLLEIYKFNTIRKYINYKDYLFICDIRQDELGIGITISSDFVIFYSGDFTILSKEKLQKILNKKIEKKY